MNDPMIVEMRAQIERIKKDKAIYSQSPGSPAGKRARSNLLQEAGFGDTSYIAFLFSKATNKNEAKQLQAHAKKLLSTDALKELFGSKAGRKCVYPDGKEQAAAGVAWLKLSRNAEKSERDAALWVLTSETPRHNKLNPPEWLNGYPYEGVNDKKRADSLRALTASIKYHLHLKDKK